MCLSGCLLVCVCWRVESNLNLDCERGLREEAIWLNRARASKPLRKCQHSKLDASWKAGEGEGRTVLKKEKENPPLVDNSSPKVYGNSLGCGLARLGITDGIINERQTPPGGFIIRLDA